jgi:hypothetical protein
MTELLALPEWNAPPRSLDDWAAELSRSGHAPRFEPISPAAVWIELAPLGLRGYAVLEGPHVTAVNFELTGPNHEPAINLVSAAARSLGWDVHADDNGEADDD